jgi:lysophospholipase L1-like esterase
MTLPPLVVRPPAPGIRALAKMFGGVRHVADQIEPYTHWWNDQNAAAMNAEGPVLAVIGDSMSLGIGASAPDKGYVGVVRDQLVASDGQPWQMVNLGQWGDRIKDGIERQLPALEAILAPDLVLVCIGSNDMVWGASVANLRGGMRAIVEAVPAPAHIATLIGTSPRNVIANRALIESALAAGHPTVNPWFKWRGNQAVDRFHPNDEGYRIMAAAFCRSIGVAEPTVASQ